MGIRTVPVNELDFVDCRVPDPARRRQGGGRLPERHDDPRPGPPGVAAQALGLAQGALEWALRYASGAASSARP